MAKKKRQPATAQPQALFTKIEAIGGDTAPTYYVNSVNLDLSSFDVRLRMGQIVGLKDGTLHVKEIAYVFMSHAHFKAFADVINKNIQKLDNIAPPRRLTVDDETTH